MNKLWESNVQHCDYSEQNYYTLGRHKRTDTKCYRHTHIIITCEVTNVLTNLIVLSVLQYTGASNRHVLNFHTVYGNFISIMPGAKILRSQPNNLCLGLPMLPPSRFSQGLTLLHSCQTEDDFKIKGSRCEILKGWFHGFTCKMLKHWKSFR